jgi:hypothetical protein
MQIGTIIRLAAVSSIAGCCLILMAQEPVLPDLVPTEITFKKAPKNKGGVNNFTLLVENQGTVDAKKAVVQFYLSDDDQLSTTTDETGGTTDTLVSQVSLGNVKPGKVKKVTQGGGLLKAYSPSGKYIIAVVDPTAKVEELDEENNTIVSEPIP